MNQWVIRGAFPGMGMEFERDWADRAAMLTPFVFPPHGARRPRGGGRRRELQVDLAARQQCVCAEGEPELVGASAEECPPVQRIVERLDRPSPPANVMELTASDASGKGKEMALGDKMVITYISRQGWGRRMLRQADHEKLVEELYKLRERYGYEVNVVNPEKLSRAEQLILAGRTTVNVNMITLLLTFAYRLSDRS